MALFASVKSTLETLYVIGVCSFEKTYIYMSNDVEIVNVIFYFWRGRVSTCLKLNQSLEAFNCLSVYFIQ